VSYHIMCDQDTKDNPRVKRVLVKQVSARQLLGSLHGVTADGAFRLSVQQLLLGGISISDDT